MDALYRRMPTDRLGVSAADFTAWCTAVAAGWQADKSAGSAAAALGCGSWIAGITDPHPLRDVQEPGTWQEMQPGQRAADAVVYGMSWAPPNVDKRWRSASPPWSAG